MKYVPKAITRTVGRTVLKTQKNSPAILFAAGIVGMGATVVLACKATLRVEEVLTSHEKEMLEIGRLERNTNYGRTGAVEMNRERQQVTLKTTGKLLKLYAPTAVAGVITIACLTTSHRQLTQRNTALTAAYVSLQQFLESYRGRVRKEIGEEKERDVYYASTPAELVQDTPDGPKKIYGSRPIGSSPYSCVFDETKKGIFQDSYEFNVHYIGLQAAKLTDKLRSQGHLFLNDVYNSFYVDHTATGQVCGWFIGHPDSDDFVDISITPLHDGMGSLLLDFNVAGNVYEMLGDGNDRDSGFRKKILGRRT